MVSTQFEDHADIQDSNFSYAIFRDSKMHSISFDNVDFTSAIFIFAQLTDADVDYSDFNSVYFYYADVRDTSFYYSSFEFVYFVEYSGDGAADIDGLDFYHVHSQIWYGFITTTKNTDLLDTGRSINQWVYEYPLL